MCTDKEYLQKPLIEGIQYKIENDCVSVSCEHTNYCRVSRLKNCITKKQLLDMYKEIIKKAKEKHVSISYKNGYKNVIMDEWELYENQVYHYNTLFDNLINAFKYVQQRGIHSSTCDDTVLQEAIDIRNSYEKVFYRNTVYSKMNDIYNSLNKLLQGLNDNNTNYFKIYL